MVQVVWVYGFACTVLTRDDICVTTLHGLKFNGMGPDEWIEGRRDIWADYQTRWEKTD